MSKPIKYGSDIPGARVELFKIAEELAALAPQHATRIRDIIESMMIRKGYKRISDPHCGPITDAVKAQIRQLARTKLSQQQIAVRLGINAGRVSEVLNGRR